MPKISKENLAPDPLKLPPLSLASVSLSQRHSYPQSPQSHKLAMWPTGEAHNLYVHQTRDSVDHDGSEAERDVILELGELPGAFPGQPQATKIHKLHLGLEGLTSRGLGCCGGGGGGGGGGAADDDDGCAGGGAAADGWPAVFIRPI